MPDGDKESNDVKKPSFDPSDLLNQLKGIAADNKKPGGGGKSWVSTLVLIAVGIAALAAWSWFSWRRGRELAKLRHEKNKAKILAAKAETDRMLAKDSEEHAVAERTLEKAEERLRIIDADIRAEEGRHEADLRAINSIDSWHDAGVR